MRGQKIELSTIPTILNVALSIRGCDVISIKNLLDHSNDNWPPLTKGQQCRRINNLCSSTCFCGINGQFIKIISHYKKIGYNINVLQQTACLVVNPITVGNFAFLFKIIARRWVGLQTLWWFRLKDLSIDEMVGAWCFGCLSGPPGFTCWISFAPVFSLIYCWVLILALSPC